jgi:hypothetical protein
MRKRMSDEKVKKQAITGFKIMKYDSRKARDTEKLRIILEAEVDEISCGNYKIGDVLGALQHHQSGETDVGLSVFISGNDNKDAS